MSGNVKRGALSTFRHKDQGERSVGGLRKKIVVGGGGIGVKKWLRTRDKIMEMRFSKEETPFFHKKPKMLKEAGGEEEENNTAIIQRNERFQ